MKKKRKSPTLRPDKQKWNDEYYVAAFRLSSQGCSKEEIASQFGVAPSTLDKWIRLRPALQDALKQGKEQCQGKTPTAISEYMHYVYNLLPENLKKLYDEVKQFHETRVSLKKIDLLLRTEGKRARQYLFLHALVASNFNPSAACRFVAISLDEFEKWVREEPEFAELMQQMQVHKKNLFESALIRLVKQGDPSAVLFANRTINRDRGFSEKTEVIHGGTVNHLHHHRVVPIETLNLPLEVRRIILEALREQLPAETKAMRTIEAHIVKPPKKGIAQEQEEAIEQTRQEKSRPGVPQGSRKATAQQPVEELE